MAVVSNSSPETLDPKPDKPVATESPTPNPDPAASSSPAAPAENPNPDPLQNPNPSPVAPPPPLSLPSFVPSFRPLGMPPAPQYSTIPNPNPGGIYYQNPSPASVGIQPPGVPVTVSMPPPMRHMYPPMPYSQLPNGYMTGPPGVPPPGIPRYPGPYPNMVRPGFPPRPLPPMGLIPQISRPPIPGIRGIPSAVTPLVRPVVPIIAPTEKPQTTVYVGKIAPSVDNDFLLSLLRLCGPVKSWKRAQDPTDGTPKGFGFCEFEAAEGILRALRLLTKLSIDGQELVLNINQATREYLERYVEKKTEREKLKETEGKAVEKEGESGSGVEKQDHPKSAEDQKKEVDSGDKEDNQKFGIVTEEDRDLDRNALEKLTSMIEERIKNRPLPPPPPIQNHADTSAKSSEILPKSREGDSDVDIMRSSAVEDKNDDETTSEAKTATENDKTEASSPDRGRRHDRRSRERDRELDLKREKERELERHEREREREKVRREKERDMRMIEADRLFRDRIKEWEDRERDKERRRRDEKEREKERQRKRRNEILKDEDGSDDDDDYDDETRKRRRRGSMLEEKRRKRQHEKEDDLADRLKEEEEIAEAKRRHIEEKKQEELKPPPTLVTEENENVMMQEDGLISEDMEMAPSQQACKAVSGNDTGDEVYINSSGGELSMGPAPLQDTKQNNDAPTKKLGFGLVGSGKRTTVPSVFHEEDDENVDDKKMKPLVPLDYSTEELQAVPTTVSSAPPNLVAAAEFAKRISGTNPKEEKLEMERERNRRSGDRTGHRERDRHDDENTRYRNESKEKIHDRSSERERERERDRERERERERDRDRDREEKPKTENKKLLDAKQLIDMIPKTKEELFGYDINWVVYDKHELHERMRPWISKKITEFLGEEEATLVDYIVSSTKEHVQASKMLELLQSILDDEAEMFVLKMWRMLIFEIKKVEAGLSAKPRA